LLQTKNASEKIGIQSRNLIIAPIIAFASQPAIDRARKETPPENRSRAVRPRGNNHLSFFLLHRIPFGSTPASLLLFILETLFLFTFFIYFCFLLCVIVLLRIPSPNHLSPYASLHRSLLPFPRHSNSLLFRVRCCVQNIGPLLFVSLV
jgi:hypothetical protein